MYVLLLLLTCYESKQLDSTLYTGRKSLRVSQNQMSADFILFNVLVSQLSQPCNRTNLPTQCVRLVNPGGIQPGPVSGTTSPPQARTQFCWGSLIRSSQQRCSRRPHVIPEPPREFDRSCSVVSSGFIVTPVRDSWTRDYQGQVSFNSINHLEHLSQLANDRGSKIQLCHGVILIRMTQKRILKEPDPSIDRFLNPSGFGKLAL
ncbi:hypothetical protein BJX61DRAFT_356355 [Aspergillus egyptiacus]|nr:hypothetical protein BJX61DRAFT_356355 [Aspergillus egyptiacus]